MIASRFQLHRLTSSYFSKFCYRFYNTSKPEITLYQYVPCPFCNKVKAYLDYARLPYKTVEVNPFTKEQIKFSKDYKRVPIAIIDGQQVNNSLDIIKFLQQKLNQPYEGDAKYEKWVDEKLVRALTVNLYASLSRSFEAFKYISSVPGWNALNKWFLRVLGSVVMRMVNPKMMKKWGFSNPRDDLFATIDEFIKDLDGKPFLYGNEISITDVMVFGVVRAVENLQVGKELFAHNKQFKEWYERVAEKVGKSQRIE